MHIVTRESLVKNELQFCILSFIATNVPGLAEHDWWKYALMVLLCTGFFFVCYIVLAPLNFI